jgi:hypothetical protein
MKSAVPARATQSDLSTSKDFRSFSIDPLKVPMPVKKVKWTFHEDELLIETVKLYGASSWSRIANVLTGRTGKQCRERWTNQLDPRLNRDNWTPTEDAVLLDQQRMFGNAWSKIAGLLPGRSSNSVKNRWCWLTRHQADSGALQSLDEAAPSIAWEPPSTELPVPKVDPIEQEEDDFVWV